MLRSPRKVTTHSISCRPTFLSRRDLNVVRSRQYADAAVKNSEMYDLIVIGSGPAGQKASIAASKLQKRVALIDSYGEKGMLGGVCVNTGTIPSKTLREAILYFSGFKQKSFYGRAYTLKEVTMADLTSRVRTVIQREKEVIKLQLERNRGIALLDGYARFVDQHTIVVENPITETKRTIRGKNILIACGTRPAHSPKIPCDGKYILDSDQILRIDTLPRSLIVVGAGVIGMEYASMLGALQCMDITVVDARPTILDFVDSELVENLTFHMRENRIKFRLGEKVKCVSINHDRQQVVCQMESGKKTMTDALLYCVGRQANTDTLNVEAAGLKTDERGRLTVNSSYQTEVPHIYAAGDVIGYPSLASSSSLQGRQAVWHMFGVPFMPMAEQLIPYGIYTIPELSMVGSNEQQLTRQNIPYEYGVSRYCELAKGMMQGDSTGGLLKILFHTETRKVLGVHAIGENATEIIHLGQAGIALGATVDYFRDTVFNYPSFAEAYQGPPFGRKMDGRN